MLAGLKASRFSWFPEIGAFRRRLGLISRILIFIEESRIDSRQQFLNFFRLFEQLEQPLRRKAGRALGRFVASVPLEQAFRGELRKSGTYCSR